MQITAGGAAIVQFCTLIREFVVRSLLLKNIELFLRRNWECWSSARGAGCRDRGDAREGVAVAGEDGDPGVGGGGPGRPVGMRFLAGDRMYLWIHFDSTSKKNLYQFTGK